MCLVLSVGRDFVSLNLGVHRACREIESGNTFPEQEPRTEVNDRDDKKLTDFGVLVQPRKKSLNMDVHRGCRGIESGNTL